MLAAQRVSKIPLCSPRGPRSGFGTPTASPKCPPFPTERPYRVSPAPHLRFMSLWCRATTTVRRQSVPSVAGSPRPPAAAHRGDASSPRAPGPRRAEAATLLFSSFSITSRSRRAGLSGRCFATASRRGTGTERWERAGGRGKRGEERRKKGKKGKKGEKGEKGKKGKKSLFLGIGPALDPGLRDVQQDTERAARRESAQECAVTGATRSRLLNDLERFFSSKTDPKARHPRGRGAESPMPAAWPGNPPELCPGGSGVRVRPVGARSRASPAGSQPPSAGSRLPPGEHEGCPLPGPSLGGCPGFSGRFPPSRPGFLARPVGRQGFPRSRRAKLFVPPRDSHVFPGVITVLSGALKSGHLLFLRSWPCLALLIERGAFPFGV